MDDGPQSATESARMMVDGLMKGLAPRRHLVPQFQSRTRRDGSAPGLELPGPSQNRYRSLLTKKFSGKRWPGHLINHYSHRPMFVPPPENDPDQRCPWTDRKSTRLNSSH